MSQEEKEDCCPSVCEECLQEAVNERVNEIGYPSINDLFADIIECEGVGNLAKEITQALIDYAPEIIRGISSHDLTNLNKVFNDEFTRTTR